MEPTMRLDPRRTARGLHSRLCWYCLCLANPPWMIAQQQSQAGSTSSSTGERDGGNFVSQEVIIRLRETLDRLRRNVDQILVLRGSTQRRDRSAWHAVAGGGCQSRSFEAAGLFGECRQQGLPQRLKDLPPVAVRSRAEPLAVSGQQVLSLLVNA